MFQINKLLGKSSMKDLEKMEALGKLLNRKDAAAYLGVSPHTLAAWSQKRDNNGLPLIKMGSNVRYKVDDLIEFVEKNRRIVRND
jgi:DNA-binding XRE family transcriptional regulator